MQIEPSSVRVDELTALKKSESVGGARQSVDVGQPALVQRSQPKSPVRSTQPGPSSLLAGKYLLVPPSDGSSMHTCIQVNTLEEFVCRVTIRYIIKILRLNLSKSQVRCSSFLQSIY